MADEKAIMPQKEYVKTQMTMLQVGRTVATLDLDSFIRQIEQAETTAPFLDPTMYRKAADNMQALKAYAKALVPVKAAFEEVFRAVVKTAAAGHMEAPPVKPPPKGA
jgi:DNA-binding NarL/FixJ family response regulator